MFSDELTLGMSADNARSLGEPRRIGELMSAVLARYRIEMVPDRAESDSATVLIIAPMIGVSELLAAR
jgi:hypothetical protein